MVSTNERKLTYIGNGSTTNFNCPDMIAAVDCNVTLVNSEGEIRLVYGVDFTVSGTRQDGFVATITPAPGIGVDVIVWRETNRLRLIAYDDNGKVNAGTLNTDFDRVVMVDQEQQEDILRGVSVSIAEDEGYQLPGRSIMKGQYLMFDPDTGDPLPGPGPIGGGNWNEFVDYGTGEIINYLGTLYRAKRPNKGNIPASSPSDWEYVIGVEPSIPYGVVEMFAGSTPPAGWLLCNGQSLLKASYPQLLAAIGTAYGGDSTTFKVPDMQGFSPVGVGTSTNSTDADGQAHVAETWTLGLKKNDKIQGHIHKQKTFQRELSGQSLSGGSSYYTDNATQGTFLNAGIDSVMNTNNPITDGSNGTPRIGQVSHGKRFGINFIIKAL